MDSPPPEWMLRKTDTLAHYMMDKFQQHIGPAFGRPPPPPLMAPVPDIHINMVVAAAQLAETLAEAFLNPININLDAARYAEGLGAREAGTDEAREKKIAEKPNNAPHFDPCEWRDRPLVLVDKGGIIIAWYLPGALAKMVEVSVTSRSGTWLTNRGCRTGFRVPRST
jgi:hypothetical protein